MKKCLCLMAVAVLVGGALPAASISQRVAEAISALEVGDYDTFVTRATGLLAVYPTFEKRGQLGLQIVKAMMYLGRYDDARRYALKLLESDPYNPMAGEISRELRLLAEADKLPEDLLASYLAGDKMALERRLGAAIDQFWEVAEDERSEGTELGRRARYEMTRMDYVLLDREYPKDPEIFAGDLIDLWRTYLADARDEEEEYLGVIELLRAYTRYARGRRQGEETVARPNFIARGVDLANEYLERFEDPDKRLNVNYRLAILYQELGFSYVLIDVDRTIQSYARALGILKKLIDENPKWHLLTRAIGRTVEMEVEMGAFDKLYEKFPGWIRKYPNDIQIGKAVEYYARVAERNTELECAFCANQLIWTSYPYTELAEGAMQRYLPILFAYDRGDVDIKKCEILYKAEKMTGAQEVAPPAPGDGSQDTALDPLKEAARKAREDRMKRLTVIGALVVVAVIVFLVTKRKA